jgi:predicted nucleotidyltransferase component of viral defense system
MITAKEISVFSRKFGVPAATIDKDWVLGHFLAGIYDDPFLKENLVFKGGTCLKKCYFRDYRFSEDLDFTSRPVERSQLVSHLGSTAQALQIQTGVLFGRIRCVDKRSHDELAAYQCTIPFWGACHPKNKPPPPEKRWTTTIKLDVTFHEILCLERQTRDIIHPYSDKLIHPFAVCYTIEEIISEKLRSLLQRSYSAPRDYFDLWYLTRHVTALSWPDIGRAFRKKCGHKNIVFGSADDFFDPDKLAVCQQEWDRSLRHHLNDIPEFGSVLMDLRKLVSEKDGQGVF